MDQGNSSMRDRLLARLPKPENLAAYREEVLAGLEKREKRLCWVKWVSRVFWLCVIWLWLVFLYRGEEWADSPHGHRWEIGLTVLFICGALQVLKYFIIRCRVEILKEVKQVQLQVLELQASLQKSGDRS
jgi:hypothetical protein